MTDQELRDAFEKLGYVEQYRYDLNKNESGNYTSNDTFKLWRGFCVGYSLAQETIKELEFRLSEKSKEIGLSEHRGNTVDFIYDKVNIYSKLASELQETIEKQEKEIEDLKESLFDLYKHCLYDIESDDIFDKLDGDEIEVYKQELDLACDRLNNLKPKTDYKETIKAKDAEISSLENLLSWEKANHSETEATLIGLREWSSKYLRHASQARTLLDLGRRYITNENINKGERIKWESEATEWLINYGKTWDEDKYVIVKKERTKDKAIAEARGLMMELVEGNYDFTCDCCDIREKAKAWLEANK